jgi:hypothetical protein
MTIAEAAAIAAAVVATAACATDHRVSPWGSAAAPPLSLFAAPADLQARLQAIDSETSGLGLTLALELHGALPAAGGPIIVRAYQGADAIGRKTHAVRIATPYAVVMAVGPLDSSERDRDQPTELVAALIMGPSSVPQKGAGDRGGELQGAALRSGTDLNGDGAPDVVLRSETGALEMWRISRMGSNRYDVILETRPTRAEDADGDGSVDLAGEVFVPGSEPISAELVDIATFDGERYANSTETARAYHEIRLQALSEQSARNPSLGDAARLKRAVEGCWHAILAGRPRKTALAALDREMVPDALRQAFQALRRRVEAAGLGRR